MQLKEAAAMIYTYPFSLIGSVPATQSWLVCLLSPTADMQEDCP
jgi:hypothetical protein